jgi:RND family efflux transporter MFP subunit
MPKRSRLVNPMALLEAKRMADMSDDGFGRRVKRVAIGGAALFGAVLVAGLLFRYAKGSEVRRWTEDMQIPTVTVLTPDRNSVPQVLILPGTLRAFYSAQLYARVPGYVQRWDRDIGAKVKRGEQLAYIDTPELDQQLSQARADLDVARSAQRLSATTAQRWGALLPLDAVSKQAEQEKSAEATSKSSAVDAAAANVHRLEALKQFGRIVAPFDGVITARNVDVGALVSGGQLSGSEPLFAVSDVHQLRVYVNVPQSYSAQITQGIKASLSVPEYSGRSFTANLVSTSDSISSDSGTLLVQLQVDNRDGALKPGSYAEVTLTLPSNPGRLVLPASALMFRANGLQVATMSSAQRVVMKPIQVGRDLGAKVEVASGIDADDKIIDNPPDSLSAGDPVRLARADHPHAG